VANLNNGGIIGWAHAPWASKGFAELGLAKMSAVINPIQRPVYSAVFICPNS
jgi:hypothetical protein